MPGIYIQDGGQTSSALGSILGGIAAQVGPEGAARAALIRQQTEEADRQNWLLSNTQQGALAIPGVLNAPGVNADPTAGAGGAGTVAGTVAGYAQPGAAQPSTAPFTRDQTASFSPFARVVAGSYSRDPSMANFATGVNLGRSATQGAGADYPTQAGIVSAQSTPQHVAAGDSLVINPRLGNAPGNVIVGGDPAQLEAEKQQRSADTADANTRARLAETATQQLTENARLLQIYNTLVNTPETNDLPGVIGDAAATEIASLLPGVAPGQLSSRTGALTAIQGRLGAGIVNKLNSEQAGTPVRGLLDRIEIPDPTKLNPEQFRAAMEQYNRVLQYQKDEGDIAGAFQNDKSAKAGEAYRAALRNHQQSEFIRQQAEIAAGAKSGGGQIYVFPDEQTMEAAGAAGSLPHGSRVQLGYGAKAQMGTYK